MKIIVELTASQISKCFNYCKFRKISKTCESLILSRMNSQKHTKIAISSPKLAADPSSNLLETMLQPIAEM